MNQFTVTILSAENVRPLRLSVRIPEEAAPLVWRQEDEDLEGEYVRDHGEAEWPDDDAIAEEIARLQGSDGWSVKYVGKGDDLLEAIYEAQSDGGQRSGPRKNAMTPTDLRNLTALAYAADRYGEARNEKIGGVPGYGDVTVQYRAIHRLADLGLVTWESHTVERTIYRGHLFGRTWGTRTHRHTYLTATLTPAGRAALARRGA